MKTPSKKQIKLVNKIATALNIDFPVDAYDFSYDAYNTFIEENLSKYQKLREIREINEDFID